MDDRSFQQSTKLAVMVLTNNKLTEIPPTFNTHLPGLRQLALGGNQISKLPARLRHPSLAKLDLHGNDLTSIPTGFLDELANVQEIRLDGNKLTSIPPFLFRSMKQLHLLRLNGNKLASLPRCMFQDGFSFGDEPFGRLMYGKQAARLPMYCIYLFLSFVSFIFLLPPLLLLTVGVALCN